MVAINHIAQTQENLLICTLLNYKQGGITIPPADISRLKLSNIVSSGVQRITGMKTVLVTKLPKKEKSPTYK